MFHGGGGRRVAKAGSVIDVVRAEEPRHFLSHVIDFIRDAARGEKKSEPMWVGVAKSAGDSFQGVIPRNAFETAGAFFAKHRIRKAAESAQFGVGFVFEIRNVFKQTHV